jgi:hypothetical protein
VATVTAMRALDVPPGRTLAVLEGDYGRGVYAGWDFRRVAPSECLPFDACLARERLDVVVVDRRLADNYAARGDRGFAAFAREPERFGFDAHPVAGGAARVLVRRWQ